MELTAEEYLKHRYELPEKMPDLPLATENFVSIWEKSADVTALEFFGKILKLEPEKFNWQAADEITINFAETLGGKLPVINTSAHKDFLNVEAMLNARNKLAELPPTVNAFTMSAKNEKICGQKIILLNRAPYSNIPTEKLNISEKEWLDKSYTIRLYHECAHYETLRIFGSMRNHALDEILADSMGQIAAFGKFSAEKQKLFFGLHGDKCDGRLTFYCRKVAPSEHAKIFAAVDKVLDLLEPQINTSQSHFELLKFLACKSIWEILQK